MFIENILVTDSPSNTRCHSPTICTHITQGHLQAGKLSPPTVIKVHDIGSPGDAHADIAACGRAGLTGGGGHRRAGNGQQPLCRWPTSPSEYASVIAAGTKMSRHLLKAKQALCLHQVVAVCPQGDRIQAAAAKPTWSQVCGDDQVRPIQQPYDVLFADRRPPESVDGGE